MLTFDEHKTTHVTSKDDRRSHNQRKGHAYN